MSKDYVELLQDKETGTFYTPYATYYCRTKEDAKKLQEAIEKQVPKRIVVSAYRGTKYCPSCESNITGMRFEYCVICGQKLDWSEVE